MKFVVKHSCRYNENITQKMDGKHRKKKQEREREEGKKGRGKEGGIIKFHTAAYFYFLGV